MTDMIKSLIRRDARYEIKNSSELTVSIQKGDGSSQAVEAELLNISAGGAKFKVNQSIGVEDIVSVKIEVSHPSRIIAKSGRVCWVAPFTGNDWWLGCAFDQPIENEILHELAVSGVLERRRYRRDRVELETEAKWELSSETVDVRILNYSPGGGFCMFSTTEGTTGERVLLRLKLDERREYLVCGCVRWQVESENGYTIGCEFVHSRNSAVLSEVLAQKRKSRFIDTNWLRAHTQDAVRRWPLPLGVAAIAATVVFSEFAVTPESRLGPASVKTTATGLEPVSVESRPRDERRYDTSVAQNEWLWRRFDEQVEHPFEDTLSLSTDLSLMDNTDGLPLLHNVVTETLVSEQPEDKAGPRLGDEGDW